MLKWKEAKYTKCEQCSTSWVLKKNKWGKGKHKQTHEDMQSVSLESYKLETGKKGYVWGRKFLGTVG